MAAGLNPKWSLEIALGSQRLCRRLIGLESSRRTCEGRERHWHIGCWCQRSAMALTVWATNMRRGCQMAEALGFEEVLLRLRCQRGCLRSHSLICRGRIGGRQGSTAYRECFLQSSLWIPWHSAEIDGHFSAYGIALAIRACLIRIARGTFGIRTGSQEMGLFVQSHLLVALTQGLERTLGRRLLLLQCARRQAGLPTLSRSLFSCRLFRTLCRLLSSSRRDVHAVLWHRTLARLPRQDRCRGDATHVE
jgi:hypothetical protein